MVQDEGWSPAFAFCGTVVFIGIILVYLQAILVPFVLAIFLAYLVRPFAEWISTNLCLCRRRSRGRAPSRPLQPPHDPDEEESLLPKPAERPSSGVSPGLDVQGALNRGATMGGLLVEEATQHISTGLPRWVGVLLAMALAVLLIAAVVVLMASSVSSLGSRLDAYQQRAHDLWAIAVFHLRPLGLELPDQLILPSKAISATLGGALNAGLGLLNYFMLVLIFLIFLLLEQEGGQRSPLRKRIDDSVSRYLVLKSLICLSLALFTFLVLTVLSFPLALFLAIVTYILSFIPNLGPMVAALLPLPICLLDTAVPIHTSVLAILLPALAHVLTGNLLEPKLFGSQFQMSPVVILFSLGVWWSKPRPPATTRRAPRPRPAPALTEPCSLSLSAAVLWGIVGAMLAVPLTSILRLIASDLMQNGDAGYYIIVINQLLEGRALDSIAGTADVATPQRRNLNLESEDLKSV